LTSTLFPYTTLFRSVRSPETRGVGDLQSCGGTAGNRARSGAGGADELHAADADYVLHHHGRDELLLSDRNLLPLLWDQGPGPAKDRKSTRLNSSHCS